MTKYLTLIVCFIAVIGFDLVFQMANLGVDENGFVKEPSYCIPLAWFFLAIGMLNVIVIIRSTRKPSFRW